jgi:hypothetical protein
MDNRCTVITSRNIHGNKTAKKDGRTVFLDGEGSGTGGEAARQAGALAVYSVPQAPQLQKQEQMAEPW